MTEKAVDAHERQLSDVLSDFARTMATDFPIQSILDHLVLRIVDMLPVTGAGVTLISPGKTPRYIAASNAAALQYEQLQTELSEGPCLLAYHSGVAVSVPDLRDESRFPHFTPRALRGGLQAVFTFPLRHGDHQLGALDLYRGEPGALSADMMASAQTLADVTSAYLINAQAREALQESSDHSRELALHDGLTGLPNRTLILERLQHAFERSRRTGKSSAVLFVDLDGFKAVNDTYGHGVGDELLVSVGKRLKTVLRPADTVARLHGDEFVILCEDLDDPDQTLTIMTRVSESLGMPFLLSSARIKLTASVGIAFADAEIHDPEQVLRDADAAMYRAKRAGGGRQHVFDPRYQHLSDGHDGIENELRRAIERGEIYAEYQPIVATATGAIVGFEALARWQNPHRGLILPAAFIPLAEHVGLITEIGGWMLDRACADRRGWSEAGHHQTLQMAVNVSPQQLMTAGFADLVARAIESSGAPAHFVTLEITESVFVRDSDRALQVLNDLKSIGVKIALDDFGTGYSSLSYLSKFPVDIVKIDRTFIHSMGTDSVSDIIVTAVVSLAHALGMAVIAEGVETIEQYEQVKLLGCETGQGFYFAAPMSAANADLLMRSGRDGGAQPVIPVPRNPGLADPKASIPPALITDSGDLPD